MQDTGTGILPVKYLGFAIADCGLSERRMGVSTASFNCGFQIEN